MEKDSPIQDRLAHSSTTLNIWEGENSRRQQMFIQEQYASTIGEWIG